MFKKVLSFLFYQIYFGFYHLRRDSGLCDDNFIYPFIFLEQILIASVRLASGLCISHCTISDILGIIMNTPDVS